MLYLLTPGCAAHPQEQCKIDSQHTRAGLQQNAPAELRARPADHERRDHSRNSARSKEEGITPPVFKVLRVLLLRHRYGWIASDM